MSIETTTQPTTEEQILKMRGLTDLMRSGDPDIKRLKDESESAAREEHPFGLDIPEHEMWPENVVFDGDAHPDLTPERVVSLFLSHLRAVVGFQEGTRITLLRVFYVLSEYADSNRAKDVYFEIQVGDESAYISGRLSSAGGAGRTAIERLEAVFMTLRVIYDMGVVYKEI